MILDSYFEITLFTSAFLVTTVFGFLLVFQRVIMPGIAKLNDGDYLHAFQVIDGVIQNNEPVFVTVWIGSVVALVVATTLGWTELVDEQRYGLTGAMLAYLVTQVTTFTINVPMNNRVKKLKIASLDVKVQKAERKLFEGPWRFWNLFRTIVMGCVSVYLLFLLSTN